MCIFFRLILIGGCSGFLKNMKTNKVKPDIKTFTQLLEVIPPTITAERVSFLTYKLLLIFRSDRAKNILCFSVNNLFNNPYSELVKRMSDF